MGGRFILEICRVIMPGREKIDRIKALQSGLDRLYFK